MKLSINLSDLCAKIASESPPTRITSEVIGPDELYKVGDEIEYGIRQGSDGCEFFAQNITTRATLPAGVYEQPLGHGFKAIIVETRRYKPKAPVELHPGKQDPKPSDPWLCDFQTDDPDHPLSLLRRKPLIVIPSSRGKSLIHWAAYLNIAAFSLEGHVLWVPARWGGPALVLPHLPQLPESWVVEDFIMLAKTLDDAITFMNGRHAGISQDSLHFQSVACPDLLPIEVASVEHSGHGKFDYLVDYPLVVLTFSCDQERFLSPFLASLIGAGYSFNLLGVRGRIFLVPRNPEWEAVPAFPLIPGIPASMEVSGRLIFSDPSAASAMTWSHVEEAFKKIGIPMAEVEKLAALT
jgi:hypothetical protein